LLFEGEFIDGFQKKGKVYYNNGLLEYEGEFIAGKKWNGKGYDKKGNVIYEFINGTGKEIELDESGKVLSEEEYINGIPKKLLSNPLDSKQSEMKADQ